MKVFCDPLAYFCPSSGGENHQEKEPGVTEASDGQQNSSSPKGHNITNL
jgi:hypothetical protein